MLVGPYTFAAAATRGLATTGLLGNHDGDPLNDLVTRDGQAAQYGTDRGFLHGPFADAWRISQEQSLFTYAAGETTASFDDRDFPREIRFSDYPADEVADARAACASVPGRLCARRLRPRRARHGQHSVGRAGRADLVLGLDGRADDSTPPVPRSSTSAPRCPSTSSASAAG